MSYERNKRRKERRRNPKKYAEIAAKNRLDRLTAKMALKSDDQT